jgi:hypothetical protein
MLKNYSVEEVKGLFASTVVDTFAATDDGQAHLNRIAKAITNTAFDKEIAKVATKTPDKLAALLGRKDAWIADYKNRKYGQEAE